MNLNVSGVFLTVLYCVYCLNEDAVKSTEVEIEEDREGKQLGKSVEKGGWRAVGSSEWKPSDEWVPQESSRFLLDNAGNPIVRRRRIRKRKRRPAVINTEDPEPHPQRRRKVRPQTLEEVKETWVEIEEELPRRSYNRRRTSPVYENKPEISTELPQVYSFDFVENTQKPPRVYEKVRDPFTALAEVETKARPRIKQTQSEQNQETTTNLSYLKALLKQSGSLNLSELLQQKNLSLGDLLAGKPEVISALTEKPETSTVYKNVVDPGNTPSIIELPKTVEPKIMIEENIIKNTNRNYDITDSSSESIMTTTEILNLLKIKSTPRQIQVKTSEPTTERRIFVPSHPKHYTFFNYKPVNIQSKPPEVNQAPSVTTTVRAPNTKATTAIYTQKPPVGSRYITYRSKYIASSTKGKITAPTTNAIAHQAQDEATSQIPLDALKINIKDVLGISKIIESKRVDGPVKMSIDIESLMKKVTTEEVDQSENEVTTENKKEPIVNTEKVKSTTARDEIMEILQDQMSRQNLARILEMRNMTIEELVAQRERGSSQLHLADIFHNQTREPEPPNEPAHVGRIGSFMTGNFFDRRPKTIANPIEIKKDSEGSKYFSSAMEIQPALPYENKSSYVEDLPTKPKYTVTSFPTYKIEMEKILKHNQLPPYQISIWKDLYPNLYTGDSSEKLNINDVDLALNDIQRIEDIDNKIAESGKSQFSVRIDENNFEDEVHYFQLPRGVKSAIIASSAIVGISVFVFLTVFFIFKWSQKQKQRFSYPNSFGCSRIKSPILDTRPRRTIRTIMSETIGRRKKYSNVYPQSMSDYIWESDKKPFQ